MENMGRAPSSVTQGPKGLLCSWRPLPWCPPEPWKRHWASEAKARQGQLHGHQAWCHKGHMRGLVLCHCLAVLNNFRTRALHFHFALGPACYVAGPAPRVQPCVILPGVSTPPGLITRWKPPGCCLWSPPPSTTHPPLETSPLFHLLNQTSQFFVSLNLNLKERSAPYLSHRLGKALSSRAQSPPFLPERENGQNPLTLSWPASPNPLRSSSLHQEIFPSTGQVVTSSLKLVGITAPILQTNKLRPREVQRLAKNHTVSRPPILLNVSIDLVREGRKWGHKWAKLWLM